MIRTYAILAAVVILLVALWGWGSKRYGDGVEAEKGRNAVVLADIAKAAREAADKARGLERAVQLDLATIDATHQRELRDAQATHDATVASLSAGALELQDRWANRGCPNVPGAPAAGGGADAAAADIREGAADLVQAGDEADAQIRGLQGYAQAALKLCGAKQ